ncbi:hypothetical protein N7G274_001845 [Stereocaulon virgatum]|uniref:Uncharacterized protein n=1 Tax=Stereocaulon virgatum TaxID=373712 RepID=A0ABR4AMQ5_9LECA
MGMPRPLAPPAAPAALVLVPRSADPVRPQQPAHPGEAAMGRAIISRARTGAFQERAQREQPHHHGGHPRSTEIPTALAKVTKAKETKAEEQDRINSEGLFIQVIIYECRWKQITVRGKDYSWEQIQKDKLTGEGMDYGSVYVKWDTTIRGWKEYIMLPQTPQWKHNPRVHTDIESYGLGAKGIG